MFSKTEIEENGKDAEWGHRRTNGQSVEWLFLLLQIRVARFFLTRYTKTE
jgi:hypothetical protein